jgi:hypothetical protein
LQPTSLSPKDADVLVTIDAGMDLSPLARLGRRLKGTAQKINLGGDIFLVDADGRYMGGFATTGSAIRVCSAGRNTAADGSTSMTISTS